MADTEFTEEYGSDGGGKVKRAVGVLAVFAVLLVLLKLRRGGSSSGEESAGESGGEDYVELDESDEREGVDTVSTSKDEEDEIEVTTSKSKSKIGGGRFEELDVVDYLGILAAALQAARDEYRIRTSR
ncbi:hypothetical protein [Halomarina pelagica]|uniref:hypothetical protein n=1 Tax=Halomarina pelagica TaxID=2961599 RepID=UPI0020C4206A|nr:hypothetical protein [Halomarina sp. BND7]